MVGFAQVPAAQVSVVVRVSAPSFRKCAALASSWRFCIRFRELVGVR